MIDKHEWQLYYSQVYPAYASSSDDFILKHLNGDIHQITPKDNFSGFKDEYEYKVKLWVKSTLITESQLMPNYWLSSEGLIPVVIASTKTVLNKETGLEQQPWVVPFTDLPKQIKSAPNDINQYASTTWLFNNEPQGEVDDNNLAFTIIPTPKSMSIEDKQARLDLAPGLNIKLTGGIKRSEVVAALDRLALLGIKESSNGITVNIALDNEKSADWRQGHYQLVMNDSAIIISAQDSSGAFYGLQSLAGLMQLGSTEVPLVSIDDQPHYEYRGQHVDVARKLSLKGVYV